MDTFVINPEYSSKLESYIKQHAYSFDNQGVVIHEDRNIIRIIDVEGIGINIKIFKKPHIINQIAYALFRPSKAKRSYINAKKLIEAGFNTPTPIAYMEHRTLGIFFHESIYVSKNMTFDGIMKEFHTAPLSGHEELLRQFSQYTASLHNADIYHQDYSSGNILYYNNKGNYSFYLVDLNRMDFGKPISMEKGCACFRRLWSSEEVYRFILSEYAKRRGFNEQDCIEEGMKQRINFWKKFNKKYPRVRPYIGD